MSNSSSLSDESSVDTALPVMLFFSGFLSILLIFNSLVLYLQIVEYKVAKKRRTRKVIECIYACATKPFILNDDFYSSIFMTILCDHDRVNEGRIKLILLCLPMG